MAGERSGQSGFPSGHAIPPMQPRMGSTRDDVKHGRTFGCWGVTREWLRLLAWETGTRRPPTSIVAVATATEAQQAGTAGGDWEGCHGARAVWSAEAGSAPPRT
jgi:hypothetical protein